MALENEKANVFIQRLMANSALKNLSLLQREEQILHFLKANAKQLYPTLASSSFFPGKGWNYIYSSLYNALIKEINIYLFPELKTVIESRIDFAFIHFIEERKHEARQVKNEIAEFLKRLLQKPEARQSFIGAYTAVLKNLPEPYIDEVFERKKYIHFELTKVQKLTMDREEVKNFILTSLLLKPSVHLLTAGSGKDETLASGVVNGQFVDKAYMVLSNQLKSIPKKLLKASLDSNLSFIENKHIETTSRITSIFAARGRSYKPSVKVDRGADSPDKSWFNIARRNYKYYGFDSTMLDEFYKIAAENGW